MRLYGAQRKYGLEALVIFGLVSAALVSIAAGQNATTAPDRTLNSPPWTVPHQAREGTNTMYPTSYPPYGPRQVDPNVDCQSVQFKVPPSYVGFWNQSQKKIGLLLEMRSEHAQQADAPKPVVLDPGEFITSQCENCSRISVIIPGSNANDKDFRMNLTGGNVYVPRYNDRMKRWEISLMTTGGDLDRKMLYYFPDK